MCAYVFVFCTSQTSTQAHRCLHPHFLHRKKQNVSEPNGTKVTFTSRKHKQKSKKLIAWFFVAHNETHTAFTLALPLLRFQMNFFLHATFSINNLYQLQNNTVKQCTSKLAEQGKKTGAQTLKNKGNSSSNWILTSCQPHRVTSGQSNSGHKQNTHF